jgi:hypothetical protein
MNLASNRIPPLALAAVALAATVRAQTLYTLDRTNGFVFETTGIEDPCLLPISGPIQSLFATVGNAQCPGLGPISVNLGDIAVDPIDDVVYVTDGSRIAAYSAAEEQLLASVTSPMPALTGLGVDAAGRLLWITDGSHYGALELPLASCAPVDLVFGPLAVPIGTVFSDVILDLDWDEASGALLACDAQGYVGSFLVDGSAGPYATYQAGSSSFPGACAALDSLLLGLAVDRARAGSGIVYLTDGFTVARFAPGGSLAPPTFYAPDSCYDSPASTFMCGLGFAGRLVPTDAGGNSFTLRANGQSWIGNPNYGLSIRGVLPGSMLLLQYSFDRLCPWLSLPRGARYFLAAPRFTAARFTTTSTVASMSSAIPPTIPPGLELFVQWLVLRPDGRVEASPVGVLTTILP